MEFCCRLDFFVRKEYQFLKKLFSENEIVRSIHLHSLESYYHALIFILKLYKHFSSHSDYPAIFAEPEKLNKKYKEFLRDYMSECSTADHLHTKIKEFQLLKFQNGTSI